MSEFTQTNRLLAVHTPLPFDTLLLNGFVGSEGVSSPFRFELKLLADVAAGKHKQVKPKDLLGKSMSIEMQLPNNKSRFFNGVVRRFSFDSQNDRFAAYRAEVVPWFSLLTLTSDCRIFQNATAPEIIEKVVGELKFTSLFRNSLIQEYRKMDYCVQYRESDFNFLSRLMEEEGIMYHFEHVKEGSELKHYMVLTDSTTKYLANPQQSSFVFAAESGTENTQDAISLWESHLQVLNGGWVLRDHHFEMPGNTLEVTETTKLAPDQTKSYEIYDYPGEYAERFNETGKRLDEVSKEGNVLVRKRMEGDECHYSLIRGVSQSRAFSSGFKITVTGGNAQRVNGSFLLTSVQHSASQHPAYDMRPTMDSWYDNSFTAIPADVLFRPPRKTPKPLVHGSQTATVIPDDKAPKEEIWPDKYGRVKVRFNWDRRAEYACWIRVGQVWASNGFGYQWVPRVGDEVIVGFLDGDPDAPIILGSVYNGKRLPPFDLPDNKTQSGIKTRSSPKGSPQNFNMIRFEDKKDHEELNVQAERNLVTLVKANESRSVGGSRSTTIHKDDTEVIEEGNESLTIKKGNRDVKIETGNDTLTVTKGDITIDASVGTYKLTAKNVQITGLVDVKISCGASTIELTPAMITITSPLVKINS